MHKLTFSNSCLMAHLKSLYNKSLTALGKWTKFLGTEHFPCEGRGPLTFECDKNSQLTNCCDKRSLC